MTEEIMFLEARDAIINGQRQRARDLLTRLLKIDQENPNYWLWMSSVVDTKKEKIFCLENTLRLDPDNIDAQRGSILLGALSAPEEMTSTPIIKRKWEADLTKQTSRNAETTTSRVETTKLTASPMRILLFMISGAIVIFLIILGITGLGLKPQVGIGSVQLTVTPITWTPKPTATLLPTNTPRVKTSTPTFVGPTPLWMFLEATYTPTPIYVDTPHPITEAYRAGLRSYHRGNLLEVLQYMEQAAEIEPESADIFYYLGEANRQLGDYEKALAAYEKAISLDPNFGPAYLGRARVNLEVNSGIEVEDDLNQALSLDPNLTEGYLVLAEYYLQQKDPEAALDTLSHKELQELDSPFIQLYKAQAYLLLENPDDALDYAENALELDQTLLPAYLTLGRVYTDIGMPSKAIDLLRTYSLYISDNSISWVLLGKSYFELNQLENALEALNNAIALDENIYEAYIYRGNIYLEKGEGQLAVNDFFTARTLVPKTFEACLGMAHALQLAERIDDALRQINSCQSLITNDNQQASFLHRRGFLYDEIGNFRSAVNDWESLLALPEDVVLSSWRSTIEKRLNQLTPTPMQTLTSTPSP